MIQNTTSIVPLTVVWSVVVVYVRVESVVVTPVAASAIAKIFFSENFNIGDNFTEKISLKIS